MAKNSVKAAKLVDKATDVFSTAKDKVIKANELLVDEIIKEEARIEELLTKIENLEDEVSLKEYTNEEKHKTIEDNNELIDKLEQFITK